MVIEEVKAEETEAEADEETIDGAIKLDAEALDKTLEVDAVAIDDVIELAAVELEIGAETLDAMVLELDEEDPVAVEIMLELVIVAVLEIFISTEADFNKSLKLELANSNLLEIELTDVGLAVLKAA